LICGTSTGGIIATLIGIRRFDLEKCEFLYKDFARKVFVVGIAPSASEVPDTEQKETWGFARLSNSTILIKSGSFYKTGPLLAGLRTNCGLEFMIDTTVDPEVTKVFAVSTLVSQIPPIPYIFRNYEYPLGHESRYPGTSRTRIFHALQGSTAAPSYFDDYISIENPNDRMQDGGISCNNPSALAVHEATKLWPNRSIDCVVSMGTGRTPVKQNPHSGVRGVLTTLAKCATSSERVDDAMRDCFDLMFRMTHAKDNGSHRPPFKTTRYFRVNPLHKCYDCPLDETREERFFEMQQATREYIQQNQSVFEEIAAALKDYDDDDDGNGSEEKDQEGQEEFKKEKEARQATTPDSNSSVTLS
jgi:predicted acylesterase/phospholipase RssA